MSNARRYGPSFVVLVTAALVLLAGPALIRHLSQARTQAIVRQARQELNASAGVLEELNQAIRSIARAVEPSVVHINILRERNNEGGWPIQSTGSGWVYDGDGHIVTNEHVIAGATVIEVQFSDGTPRQALLVGSDEKTDIAIVRVDSHAVIPAVLATGEPVSQGDLVFAFGSPFGFEFSMSAGIVSGDRRHTTGGSVLPERYENYIQIDAAINPGNSGGPLTNSRGKVVGMNVSIAVDPGGNGNDRLNHYVNSGVGFAIPLDTIVFVADQLIQSGTVQRGGLGASFVDVRDLVQEDQQALRYDGAGIVLTNIVPGSSAQRAGLRVNDVILELDGQAIRDGESFRTTIHGLAPGARIALTVLRDGREHQIAVILGTWGGTGVVVDRANTQRPNASRTFESLGLSLTEVDEELALRLDLEVNHGLYIQSVRVDSQAWDLGFKAGGVIVLMNGEVVRTLDQFAGLIASEAAREGFEVTVAHGKEVRSELNFLMPQNPDR